MKLAKKTLIASILITIITSWISCRSDILGKWEPMKWNEGIVKKQPIQVAAEGQSFIFTCKNYDSFRLAGVQENGKDILVSDDNADYWTNVLIEKNSIKITFKPNYSKERAIQISVTAGDIFDHFSFIQQAK